MAAVDVSKLKENDIAELACTYATLLLHDDGQDITGQKISTILAAANLKVPAFWPKLFAKTLAHTDISTFFNFTGTAPAAEAPAPAPKKEEKVEKKVQKKVEKKPEPKVEEDEGMGGLFD